MCFNSWEWQTHIVLFLPQNFMTPFRVYFSGELFPCWFIRQI